MDSSTMVKLMIMLAIVCFPVAHPLPTEASPLPQNSTHLRDETDCENVSHDVVCKLVHGLGKNLCVIGCLVGCSIIHDKDPADNPTFRRIHSCAVETCAKLVGKDGIEFTYYVEMGGILSQWGCFGGQRVGDRKAHHCKHDHQLHH